MTLPKNLAYSIRFPARMRKDNDIWPTTSLYSMTIQTERSSTNFYVDEGFTTIQNAMAKAFIINMSQTGTQIDHIEVQRFPSSKKIKPSYLDHAITISTGSLMLMIGLCFIFMNTVRFVTFEKEKQLKETMKIMGLASWMHYLGWFIRTLIMLSISMALITVFLTVSDIHTILK